MGNIKCISRLKTLFGFGSRLRSFCCAPVVKTQAFFIAFLIIFSSFAQAEDFIFNDNYGNVYPSASAACSGIAGIMSGNGYTFTGAYILVPSARQFQCSVINPWGSQDIVGGGTYRGDSCPSTMVANSDGSGCSTPDQKCKDAKGTTAKSHSWQQTTDTPTAPPVGGCASTIGGVAICRANATMGGFTCTADVTITGDLYVPPPPTTTPGTGDDDTGGDTGGGNTGDPGGDTGGETGGGDTGGGSNGGSNGGGSGGGGSGGGSGGSGGTGGGSGDSGDGSGSGDSGGGTGGGGSGDGSGGGGSGDGNGSGDGECTGDDCGEEGDDKVSGDMQCDTVVSCDGDVIQCAILRQDHQSRCADKDFRDLSEKKVADLKTSLSNEFAGQDYQPIKPTTENTFDLSKMIDTSSRFGASCPALPVISVPFVNGTSFRFDPNFDGLCTFLTYMGYLMVAFAMRRAAEIIATGV